MNLHSLSEVSASGTQGSSVKNKHHDDEEEEDMEAEQHEVKRLKFSKEDEQEGDTLRHGHNDSLSEEAESMVQEDEKRSEAPSTAGTCEDQGRTGFSTLYFRPSCRHALLVQSFVDISTCMSRTRSCLNWQNSEVFIAGSAYLLARSTSTLMQLTLLTLFLCPCLSHRAIEHTVRAISRARGR